MFLSFATISEVATTLALDNAPKTSDTTSEKNTMTALENEKLECIDEYVQYWLAYDTDISPKKYIHCIPGLGGIMKCACVNVILL